MHRILTIAALLTLGACNSTTDATPAPEPTAVIQPTSLPPTALPPTATPVPEPTEVGMPGDVREYLEFVADVMVTSSPAMGELGARSTAMGSNPALMLNDEWRFAVAGALATFSVQADRIRSRSDVPEEAVALHAMNLEFAGLLETMATEYARGIDDLDQGAMTSALGAVRQVKPLVDRMNTETQSVIDSYKS